MTRPLLLSLFLLISGFSLQAQTFQGSLLGGFNMSQIDGDDLLGFNYLGFNAGMRVVAVLNDRWRVGPEILYSTQGSRRGNNEFNISNYDRFALSTIEVPLMVYFKDWRFTAEAGVAYQRLINYKIEDAGGADITADIPFREDLFNFQVGVTFYVRPNFGINFRWSKHINDLEANDGNLQLKGRNITIRGVFILGTGEELPDKVEAE